MSRYAYPASSAREDVSFHGSADAREEMKKIIEKELREGIMLTMVNLAEKKMEKVKKEWAVYRFLGATCNKNIWDLNTMGRHQYPFQ